jgi:glutamine amidotransferase
MASRPGVWFPVSDRGGHVAIVDYGMGNLHNVKRACAHVGLDARITSEPTELLEAAGVILPGVGAMPEAMRALMAAGLADALHEVVRRSTPLLGICLGLQLLMSHGTEFCEHAGLGIIAGRVERFPRRSANGGAGVRRVPHVGWKGIHAPVSRRDAWRGTVLGTTGDGANMYFVHSYYVAPAEPALVVATAVYDGFEFVAAVSRGSVFACQFHPERSGPAGLEIIRQFAGRVVAPAEGSI